MKGSVGYTRRAQEERMKERKKERERERENIIERYKRNT